jgi:adenylate cyclase
MEALDQALASGAIVGASRRGTLLRYLVEAELDGRGDRLKAYTLGTDVLGRGADFDPATDSIVRVEVGRLREALALHNASLPHGAPRIEIPKGGYRPSFVIPEPAESAPVNSSPAVGRRVIWAAMLVLAAAAVAVGAVLAIGPRFGAPAQTEVAAGAGETPLPDRPATPFDGVRLVIDPFHPLGAEPDLARISTLLGAELASDLSAFPWLSVLRLPGLGPETLTAAFDSRPASAPDALLSGDLSLEAERLSARLRLVSYPGFEVIWTETISVPLDVVAIEDAQWHLAAAVADRVAARHGIAPDLARTKAARRSGASLEDFLCVTGLYDYWDHPSDALHETLRDCLEDVHRRYPDYGAAAAALTFLYMDEARQGRNPRPESDPWADAGRTVSSALLNAPLEQTTLLAALAYAIDRPDRDEAAFRRHGERLIRQFPRDPVALMTFASKLGPDLAEWPTALALAEEAIGLTSVIPEWFHLTFAYAAARSPDDGAAHETAMRITSAGSKSGNVLRLGAAARVEDRPLLVLAADNLRRQGLADAEDVRAYIVNRRFESVLEQSLVAATLKGYALLAGGGG